VEENRAHEMYSIPKSGGGGSGGNAANQT